ncbi:extracellular calcium-sensing receptor-like [Ambystoma mexicanum]|uniref:extracellular calcium-sensing receptor-like n=1 Tax=Ambystoma mexicanum TaxID=8296 RepID=UPI0037E8A83D
MDGHRTSAWFYIRYYRDVLAMIYAINTINETPELLPNITLGFCIFDSCMSEFRAIRATLQLLSGTSRTVPGYNCQSRGQLAGIIGETMSSLTVPIARIMGILHYPQISHSAALSTLSNKLQFPSFLRTVPGNTLQNIALAQLMEHFGWTWVGMIISDDEVGLQGGQQVREAITQKNSCVAFMERIHLRYSRGKVLQLVDFIQRHPVKVVIVHSAEVHLKVFLEALYTHNVAGKVWMFSAYFVISPGLLTRQARMVLNGSLGLIPYTGTMPGFEQFLYQIKPSTPLGDSFTKPFWKKAFHCEWSVANGSETKMAKEERGQPASCTGQETFDRTTLSLFELSDLSYSFHSYAAVYVFAHALNTLMDCKPGQGPFTGGSCADRTEIRPWQILHYLKNMYMEANRWELIHFDVNGDAFASFDILNIQISQNEDFQLVKIGKIDPTATEGNEVTVNMNSILWNDGTATVPHSVCSTPCAPGYRKAAREGEPICCFDCVPCSQGEISNHSGAVKCIQCPDRQWANLRQDQCIDKLTEFLSYEDPLGLMLAISASLMIFLTASILCVFIKYRNTPIVKANNRRLSYLLLLSLMLCFLCSFIFIGRPNKLTCMLRQTAFGLIFSISVSFVLAKTIIVGIAFKARHPNSSARKWLGSKTPSIVVISCSVIQGVICFLWLLRSPPFPELNMKSYHAKIIFECNEGAAIFFYCMLGYMGLLATVSFIVAFLSRNLPGSFNEAKLITFSMLVFVSVWISFIPAYLSTRGKYMVAVEVFAILCSSAGLLGCIFFPKCYIIIVRPDRNCKEHIVGKSHFGRTKTE